MNQYSMCLWMFKSKKSFPSPTVLTVLHIIKAEAKTSHPHREPCQSAGQEANENGHSQTEKNQPWNTSTYVNWVTEIKPPTKYVFINYVSTHKPICSPLAPQAKVVCTNQP